MAFNSEFENFYNIYGAIISYANPNQLYDRNTQYADVLTAISQLGKATKGVEIMGLNLAIFMSFIKIAFVFTLQVVNVFKFEWWGPIFFGVIAIYIMKWIELATVDWVTKGF